VLATWHGGQGTHHIVAHRPPPGGPHFLLAEHRTQCSIAEARLGLAHFFCLSPLIPPPYCLCFVPQTKTVTANRSHTRVCLSCTVDTAIVSLKILNWDGGGPASAIADASLWLLSQSLDGTTANPDNATNAQMLGVNVINMSFGYKASPYNSGGVQMCRIMQQLLDAGIVPVAAAGERSCLSSAFISYWVSFCCCVHAFITYL
jgi:hypothetical protein